MRRDFNDLFKFLKREYPLLFVSNASQASLKSTAPFYFSYNSQPLLTVHSAYPFPKLIKQLTELLNELNQTFQDQYSKFEVAACLWVTQLLPNFLNYLLNATCSDKFRNSEITLFISSIFTFVSELLHIHFSADKLFEAFSGWFDPGRNAALSATPSRAREECAFLVAEAERTNLLSAIVSHIGVVPNSTTQHILSFTVLTRLATILHFAAAWAETPPVGLYEPICETASALFRNTPLRALRLAPDDATISHIHAFAKELCGALDTLEPLVPPGARVSPSCQHYLESLLLCFSVRCVGAGTHFGTQKLGTRLLMRFLSELKSPEHTRTALSGADVAALLSELHLPTTVISPNVQERTSYASIPILSFLASQNALDINFFKQLWEFAAPNPHANAYNFSLLHHGYFVSSLHQAELYEFLSFILHGSAVRVPDVTGSHCRVLCGLCVGLLRSSATNESDVQNFKEFIRFCLSEFPLPQHSVKGVCDPSNDQLHNSPDNTLLGTASPKALFLQPKVLRALESCSEQALQLLTEQVLENVRTMPGAPIACEVLSQLLLLRRSPSLPDQAVKGIGAFFTSLTRSSVADGQDKSKPFFHSISAGFCTNDLSQLLSCLGAAVVARRAPLSSPELQPVVQYCLATSLGTLSSELFSRWLLELEASNAGELPEITKNILNVVPLFDELLSETVASQHLLFACGRHTWKLIKRCSKLDSAEQHIVGENWFNGLTSFSKCGFTSERIFFNLALTSENDEIAQKARRETVAIFQEYNPQLFKPSSLTGESDADRHIGLQLIRLFKEIFILFEYIKAHNCSSYAETITTQKRISRAFSLAVEVTQNYFRGESVLFLTPQALSTEDSRELTLLLKGRNPKNLEVHLPRFSKVGVVRQLVSRVLGVPSRLIRLFLSGPGYLELMDFQDFFSMYTKKSLVCIEMPDLMASTPAPSATERFTVTMRNCIESSGIFPLLFDILQHCANESHSLYELAQTLLLALPEYPPIFAKCQNSSFYDCVASSRTSAEALYVSNVWYISRFPEYKSLVNCHQSFDVLSHFCKKQTLSWPLIRLIANSALSCFSGDELNPPNIFDQAQYCSKMDFMIPDRPQNLATVLGFERLVDPSVAYQIASRLLSDTTHNEDFELLALKILKCVWKGSGVSPIHLFHRQIAEVEFQRVLEASSRFLSTISKTPQKEALLLIQSISSLIELSPKRRKNIKPQLITTILCNIQPFGICSFPACVHSFCSLCINMLGAKITSRKFLDTFARLLPLCSRDYLKENKRRFFKRISQVAFPSVTSLIRTNLSGTHQHLPGKLSNSALGILNSIATLSADDSFLVMKQANTIIDSFSENQSVLEVSRAKHIVVKSSGPDNSFEAALLLLYHIPLFRLAVIRSTPLGNKPFLKLLKKVFCELAGSVFSPVPIDAFIRHFYEGLPAGGPSELRDPADILLLLLETLGTELRGTSLESLISEFFSFKVSCAPAPGSALGTDEEPRASDTPSDVVMIDISQISPSSSLLFTGTAASCAEPSRSEFETLPNYLLVRQSCVPQLCKPFADCAFCFPFELSLKSLLRTRPGCEKGSNAPFAPEAPSGMFLTNHPLFGTFQLKTILFKISSPSETQFSLLFHIQESVWILFYRDRWNRLRSFDELFAFLQSASTRKSDKMDLLPCAALYQHRGPLISPFEPPTQAMTTATRGIPDEGASALSACSRITGCCESCLKMLSVKSLMSLATVDASKLDFSSLPATSAAIADIPVDGLLLPKDLKSQKDENKRKLISQILFQPNFFPLMKTLTLFLLHVQSDQFEALASEIADLKTFSSAFAKARYIHERQPSTGGDALLRKCRRAFDLPSCYAQLTVSLAFVSQNRNVWELLFAVSLYFLNFPNESLLLASWILSGSDETSVFRSNLALGTHAAQVSAAVVIMLAYLVDGRTFAKLLDAFGAQRWCELGGVHFQLIAELAKHKDVGRALEERRFLYELSHACADSHDGTNAFLALLPHISETSDINKETLRKIFLLEGAQEGIVALLRGNGGDDLRRHTIGVIQEMFYGVRPRHIDESLLILSQHDPAKLVVFIPAILDSLMRSPETNTMLLLETLVNLTPHIVEGKNNLIARLFNFILRSHLKEATRLAAEALCSIAFPSRARFALMSNLKLLPCPIPEEDQFELVSLLKEHFRSAHRNEGSNLFLPSQKSFKTGAPHFKLTAIFDIFSILMGDRNQSASYGIIDFLLFEERVLDEYRGCVGACARLPDTGFLSFVRLLLHFVMIFHDAEPLLKDDVWIDVIFFRSSPFTEVAPSEFDKQLIRLQTCLGTEILRVAPKATIMEIGPRHARNVKVALEGCLNAAEALQDAAILQSRFLGELFVRTNQSEQFLGQINMDISLLSNLFRVGQYFGFQSTSRLFSKSTSHSPGLWNAEFVQCSSAIALDEYWVLPNRATAFLEYIACFMPPAPPRARFLDHAFEVITPLALHSVACLGNVSYCLEHFPMLKELSRTQRDNLLSSALSAFCVLVSPGNPGDAALLEGFALPPNVSSWPPLPPWHPFVNSFQKLGEMTERVLSEKPFEKAVRRINLILHLDKPTGIFSED
eukprot:gnl/Chilomastix_cuspidata/5299.p1 GENE.gnl/Chilomastix_cuspidata/5299~~gnl/Chilomastix_cuspidata/5299.p1  ORF type:complete len:2574 (+),score=512.75 gnl/Chilomastix_cuspidata/5299:74-7795(+)